MRYKALAAISLLLSFALAPAPPPEDPRPNLLRPTNRAESWRFEQHGKGKGNLSVSGDELVLEVTEVDGTNWHVQAVQASLSLGDRVEYTLRFRARASAPRQITVTASADVAPYHTVGLAQGVDLGVEWKPYEFKFATSRVESGKSRLSFIVGNATGKVFLKDVTLKGPRPEDGL